SVSNNATEEKQAPTLAEVVRKLDTENLIEFLRGKEDLQLDEDDFKILRNQGEKIEGVFVVREVLLKYSDRVEAIPLFELPRYEIQDNDQHIAHCMADILFRMKHYGDLTKKEFSMRPEYEIIGDESSGRVDYGIKESENLICVTEDKVLTQNESVYYYSAVALSANNIPTPTKEIAVFGNVQVRPPATANPIPVIIGTMINNAF
ncbi:828_t:CDS:2, partial [Ambispora leptoticha]